MKYVKNLFTQESIRYNHLRWKCSIFSWRLHEHDRGNKTIKLILIFFTLIRVAKTTVVSTEIESDIYKKVPESCECIKLKRKTNKFVSWNILQNLKLIVLI